MNFHLYGLSEHFLTLLMQFGAFYIYFIMNIKSWICVHKHCQCFKFYKVVWQH